MKTYNLLPIIFNVVLIFLITSPALSQNTNCDPRISVRCALLELRPGATNFAIKSGTGTNSGTWTAFDNNKDISGSFSKAVGRYQVIIDEKMMSNAPAKRLPTEAASDEQHMYQSNPPTKTDNVQLEKLGSTVAYNTQQLLATNKLLQEDHDRLYWQQKTIDSLRRQNADFQRRIMSIESQLLEKQRYSQAGLMPSTNSVSQGNVPETVPNSNNSQSVVTNCIGNQVRNTNLLEKSAIFNAVGINLTKYDWSNPNVNCHINSTLSTRVQSSNLRWLAIGAATAGISMLVLVSGGSGTVGEETGLSALKPIGGVVLAGSIPLFIFAHKKKKKSEFHLQQVGDYFRTNNLN